MSTCIVDFMAIILRGHCPPKQNIGGQLPPCSYSPVLLRWNFPPHFSQSAITEGHVRSCRSWSLSCPGYIIHIRGIFCCSTLSSVSMFPAESIRQRKSWRLPPCNSDNPGQFQISQRTLGRSVCRSSRIREGLPSHQDGLGRWRRGKALQQDRYNTTDRTLLALAMDWRSCVMQTKPFLLLGNLDKQ